MSKQGAKVKSEADRGLIPLSPHFNPIFFVNLQCVNFIHILKYTRYVN